MILSAVLCVFETLSHPLLEAMVFENMVLRIICVSKWEEVSEEWRILHNEDLNHLYPSPNIICVIKPRRK